MSLYNIISYNLQVNSHCRVPYLCFVIALIVVIFLCFSGMMYILRSYKNYYDFLRIYKKLNFRLCVKDDEILTSKESVYIELVMSTDIQPNKF